MSKNKTANSVDPGSDSLLQAVSSGSTLFAKVDVLVCIALDKVHFFNQNVSIFFFFLDENICCGYSLEAPR